MTSRRKALEELAHRTLMERWRKNPLLWVKERLKEDPKDFIWSMHEGYEDHKWDGDINPLAQAWQTLGDAYKNTTEGKAPEYKYVAIESATGCAKTYTLARIVFWFLDCFPNSLVVTSAPSETQLKMGLWSEITMLFPRIKELRPHSQKWSLRLAMQPDVADEGLSDAEKERLKQSAWHAFAFTTGVKADETSSNKARGFHRKNMLIVLEEATGIPLPILTAFQNTSTGNTNYIIAVGNPDNEFDTLHQFAMQPDCKNIRISAMDFPNIVLQQEVYAGAVTQSSINSRALNYGEGSPLYNAMVRGISPAQSSDALIRAEWLDAVLHKKFPEEELQLIQSYNAVGVDVANSIDGDKASLAFGESNRLKQVLEFHCDNATHLAYNLLYNEPQLMAQHYTSYHTPTIQDYNIDPQCIGVDAVGVGVATINAFKDKGLTVTPLSGGCWHDVIPTEIVSMGGKEVEKPMYKFSNLRGQMAWELREDIRLGRIAIDIEDPLEWAALKRELCIPKYTTKGEHIEIEAKESIKKRMGGKSPNRFDAIMYWNWVRKGYRFSTGFFLPIG